jgi:hypothetical protein
MSNTMHMRTFRCYEDTWIKFKVICAYQNVSLQTKVGELIEDFVQKNEAVHGEPTIAKRTEIRSN